MIYRTSEWVSPGHPDKVADCISEHILDRLLEIDPDTRYALEVQIKGNKVSLAGEITSFAKIKKCKYVKWVKEAVAKIGYTLSYQEKWGKNNTICANDINDEDVICNISQQSPEIACGVNTDGYGDQGIFSGYAERFNPAFMPKDKEIAREIGLMLYNNALDSNIGGLDIKTQVTLDEDDRLVQLIVAIPVLDDEEYKLVQDSVMKKVYSLFTSYQLSMSQIIINGTGIYKQHGPIADSGTTGRKLAVDFYGNNAPIGGGCVDADTEYMSSNGWKKIKDYDGGLVGQINSNFELELVKPEQYIKTFHDNIYEIKTEKTTDMVLSGNHNVLYITSKGHLAKKQLSSILSESFYTKTGSHIDIPVTFTYDFKDGEKSIYDEISARIIIAHCADGTVLTNGSKRFNCRIRVKKDYKIKRLRELFSKSNIDYEEREYSDGYKYFYYNLKNPSKLLSEQFKNPDYNTAKIISEEVFWWDGSMKDRCFRTKKEVDANFVQFVLSSINGKFYSKLQHKSNKCFIIREVNKKTTSPFRKRKTNSIIKLQPQNMYCFTVPSGMLLLRRNGYIFCTGNSPWTKDGTKADLTLNLYARQRAIQELKKHTLKNAHHCLYQLCCCIGRSNLIGTCRLYDDFGVLIESFSEELDIKPSELIEKYGLKKPIYFNMCRDGMFEDDEYAWNKG